jgi:hypothetical protein
LQRFLKELVQEYKKPYYQSSCINNLHYQMKQICRLQYKLPITDAQHLAILQQAIRSLAPDLLRYGQEYLLQEIANSFNVPWYPELMQYADRALEDVFATIDDTDRFSFDHALQLQEKYKPSISPQRREQALHGLSRGIICRKKEEVARYAACFELTKEECRRVAAERSKNAINEYIARASQNPNYHSVSEHYRGEAVQVHRLMEDYGLFAEDIDPLRVATDEWQAACLKRGVNNGEELSATINRQHEGYLDQYLPDLMRSVLLRVMRNPDRFYFEVVCMSLSAAPETSKVWEKICLDLVREPHEQPLLDLHQDFERGLWSKLFIGSQLEPGGLFELEAFLTKESLPPNELMHAWRESSNDSTQKNINGVRYCDYMGTPLVFARNVACISKLQHKCREGAAVQKPHGNNGSSEEKQKNGVAYLHQRWGINMFSRYPVEVLYRQICEDWSQSSVALDPKQKKQNVLVLYPEHDWNGALEYPDFIQKLADQADPQKYNFRIAESGRRKSCLRRIARFFRQFGLIDMAVIGGHSDGESIDLSRSAHQTICLTDMREDNKRHVQLLQHLRRYFSKNGRILFKACSTGKEILENGNPGIALHAGQILNIATAGPVEPAALKQIDLSNREAIWVGDRGLALSNTFIPPKSKWERLKEQIVHFFRKSK